MNFGIVFIFFGIMFALSLKLSATEKTENKTEEACKIQADNWRLVGAIFGYALFIMMLDIPIVVNGGIRYETQLAPRIARMQITTGILCDDKMFIGLSDYRDCDDPNANYIIRYAPITHIVLDIQKVDANVMSH